MAEEQSELPSLYVVGTVGPDWTPAAPQGPQKKERKSENQFFLCTPIGSLVIILTHFPI